MKIAFTGHRPNKLGNDYELKSPLVKWIRDTIVVHVGFLETKLEDKITFIIGMALGIDQLVAKIAIEYDIPFIAAIPFKGQELIWPQQSQIQYHKILEKASEIVICDIGLNTSYYNRYLGVARAIYSKETISYLMDDRNKWMVDQLIKPEDRLIAVWDGSSGGTANCVKYANASDKSEKIIRINPLDFNKNIKEL